MLRIQWLRILTAWHYILQDPDTKKEMEEMQAKMSVQNQMPEVSELFTNFFGGGAQPKKKPAIRRR